MSTRPTLKDDLMETVRRLGHGLVDAAQNRLRLVQIELAEELDRLGVLLARQVLIAALALLTAQCFGLIVVALAWDTRWRLESTLVLGALAAAATAAAYRSYRSHRARSAPILARTLDELDKDRHALENPL